MAFLSEVLQVTDQGNPQPSYRLSWRDNAGGVPCFAIRDFGISSAAVVKFESDFYVNEVSGQASAGFIVCRPSSGIGALIRVLKSGSNWTINLGSSPNFASIQASIFKTSPLTGVGLAVNTWLHMVIDVTKNSDGTLTITGEVFNDAETTSYGTVTGTMDVQLGENCGFFGVAYSQLGATSQAWFDNIRVRASGSTNVVVQNLATSYVYTFVNDLGEESTPSEPSVTVVRPDGVSATVTTATIVPTGFTSDYGVTTKRIYRAATGNTGTAFRFVAEIPLGQADYVDTLTDAQLGEVLESDNYDLPPDDLRGILALPNGIMVGFRRNQLCFSAQNRPHAWPVLFRLNTDTDIVAIGNVDTTVVIGTKAFPYLAIGSDPAAYSMTKLEVPQACVSKRSLAYLTGIGVVFASPDGLIAVAGSGQVRNLTDSVFTRKQWQALDPETILGIAHDDVYWMFSLSGSDAQTLFEDTFTGLAGSITGHTPDTAPEGFVWLPNGTDPLRLNGSGSLIGESNEDLPGFGSAATSGWSPIEVTLPFTVYLDATLADNEGVGTDSLVHVLVQQVAPAASVLMRVRKTAESFQVITEADNGFPFSSTVTISAAGARSFQVVVSDSGVQILMGGSEIDTLAIDLSAFTSIDYIEVDIGNDGGVNSIQRLAVTISPGTPHAFALDMKSTGFGVAELAFHATAAYADPVTDDLNLVLDSDDEPTAPYLPLPSTAPTPDGLTIYQFDGNDASNMVYRYRSKLNLLSHPTVFTIAQVRAEDYTNLIMRLYADGEVFFDEVIESEAVFTLPMPDEYASLEVEFIGTSRVRTYQIAEDVMEIN